MFGSSSPFGASTPSPFGSAASSSYPFGSSSSANPFGASQAANPFGAKPFGGSTFGQTGSIFGSGTATSVFGASQPASFGSTTPAFGASASTPAFGSTTQFGGTSVFGQKPPSPFGSFGQTSPAQANPFGTASFGQSQSAFGGQQFGTATPAFGASTPSFGASTAPAFGASSTPAFGATTPAFGASSASAFGATSTPAFGASTPAFGTTPGFGQSVSAFGASTTPAFGTTPVFGSSPPSPFGAQSGSAFGAASTPAFGTSGFGATAFAGQRGGSRTAPYSPTNDQPDSGVGGQLGKLMSISAMPAFKNKSVEELRWEDYQAKDKGGPSSAAHAASTGNIFGQPQAQAPASPFAGNMSFGQPQTPNPFAGSTTSGLFTQTKPAFGASTSPAFGSGGGSFGPGFGAPSVPFGSQPSAPAFGASSSSAFGMTNNPFGASTSSFSSSAFASSPAFGVSNFGSSSSLTFGSVSSFGAPATTPSFGTSSSTFGSGTLFGQQSSIFSPSTAPAFGASSSAFGAPSTPSFGGSLFNNAPSTIFSQSKPAGLASSTPASPFGSLGTPVQSGGAFSFAPNFAASPQPGSLFGVTSPATTFGASSFSQQPLQNGLNAAQVPLSNPFGTLPAMPQMSIARSAGTGPSVQYGISSMPVSEKPVQVRTTSLLTPRHITQRSKVRLHARRYHPKKDSPKVSFFSDGEDTPTIPKADVLFVPRENPRALFIRQTDQLQPTPVTKSVPETREIATPVQRRRVEFQEREASDAGSPPAAWPSPELDGNLQSSIATPKGAEKNQAPKSGLKQNGVRDDHNHRGNGYISITGHRAGEAAIAYEHGADIEALMPKLRHSDYFTEPRIQELAAKERAEQGYCRRVTNFVVGRKLYGSVKFLGETDVRRLDLEGIIQFNRCEVLVYMDESKKPPIGQGLNKAAEVTLLNVRCLDKKTGQHFTEGPEVEKFEKKLKRKTEEQGAEFIGYNALKGEWTFRVKHFSRYGLDDSDEEETPEQKKSGVQLGAETMEVVEGSFADVSNKGEEGVMDDSSEEEGVGQLGGLEEMLPTNSVSTLPHSLPSQLRLNPVKMQQMRTIFFPLSEEVDNTVRSKRHAWSGSEEMRLPSLTSGHVLSNSGDRTREGGCDKEGTGSPCRVGHLPLKRSPQTSWMRSPAFLELELGISGKLAYEVTPDSLPLVSGGSLVALPNTTQASSSKRPKYNGFHLGLQSAVDGRLSHVSDAALSLGCSFRVGWGPHGVLVHCGKPVQQGNSARGLSSCVYVEQVALDRIVRDEQGKVKSELVQSQFVNPLSLHLRRSQIISGVSEHDQLRFRKLVCSRTELSEVCAEYETSSEEQLSAGWLLSDTRYTLQRNISVWQLIAVLFSERPELPEFDSVEEKSGDLVGTSLAEGNTRGSDAEVLVRRAMFSSWLQDCVVGQPLGDDLQSVDKCNDLQHIFALLAARQLDDAVDRAIDNGDVRLAVVLSQSGGSMLNREDMLTQLDVWTREGLDPPFIEGYRICIYKLLAGDLKGALGAKKINWKRFLGLLMWYQLAPDTPLPVTFNKYLQLVRHDDAPAPVPMYRQETGTRGKGEDFSYYDNAFYLMLLHADLADVSIISRMLSSGSSTSDWLDHTLVWHEQAVLEAVGVLGCCGVHALHMNFASQLLAVGLCHWALYVILHLAPTAGEDQLQEKAVREILVQYCETWSTSEVQQVFLRDELQIPSKWLHEAQAIYWRYAGDCSKALKHLIKSFQWHSAHTLFMSSVSADWFVNGNHRDVWKYATKLESHKSEIENWNLGAGIYIDFYSLKGSLEHQWDPFHERKPLQGMSGPIKDFFSHLRESQELWSSGARSQLVRVAYSKMAEDVARLLLQDSADELSLHEAVLEAPLLEDVHVCRLQGAATAFTSWLCDTLTV